MPLRISLLPSLAALLPLAVSAPCDIYASAQLPCVAAHSTTRALYSSYSGPLYQVTRSSDGATIDISVISQGGVADSGAQDQFCQGTLCVISIIYDQTPYGNNLTQAPSGGADSGPDPNGYDVLAAADGAPALINGTRVYGVFIQPTSGYRNNNAQYIPTGDNPETMYAVFDGTHYNSECCFDYGNAETNSRDDGEGHMEAIYFGGNAANNFGQGSGPFLMADLEDGLFNWDQHGVNDNAPSMTSRFVSGTLKGNSGNSWAIKGGDATQGGLTTFWDGARPSGYNPMAKEGAIILGIGGDNSNRAQGTFYEGCIVDGYSSDDIDNQIQADVVNQNYQVASLVSGPSYTVGSAVTFQVTTPGYTNRVISWTTNGDWVETWPTNQTSSESDQQFGSWIVHTGRANAGCYSFESVNSPGSYIRHYNYELQVNAPDGSDTFDGDSTFCPQAGLNGQGTSMRSWSYPTRYWRHYNGYLYIASDSGWHDFDATYSFTNDVSFVPVQGYAS